jgi:hypothetical protein
MTMTIIEDKLKETSEKHLITITKMTKLEPILKLAEHECSILTIFNIKVIDVEIREFYMGDPVVDVSIKVERFAEGVPAMELFEKSFGEVKHDVDWEWNKSRIFKFKNAPVRSIMVAGDGCQKIKITETHTTEKLICG